jgi:hypothetical protein
MSQCGGTILSDAEKTKATCSPAKKSLVLFRVYYILIPILLFVLFIEAVVIIMSLPAGIGTALTAAATTSLGASGATASS